MLQLVKDLVKKLNKSCLLSQIICQPIMGRNSPRSFLRLLVLKYNLSLQVDGGDMLGQYCSCELWKLCLKVNSHKL